jgi:hypothetical protein
MDLDTNLDDDPFTLTPEQASQADCFRAELRSCETDAARYELCIRKREELLDRQTELQLLIATCELIMSTECPTYRRRKQTRARESKEEDDAEQWNRFFGLAKEGDRIRSNCISALKVVEYHWGRQVIQHYQWASRGEKYCNQLRAAARKVPVWGEAALILNQSILQRSRNVRQRPVKASANPIEQHDLERLKTSSQDSSLRRKLSVNDIPDGLGFDSFNILVRKEFATASPEVGSSASARDHSDAVDFQRASASEEPNQIALDPIVIGTDAILANTCRDAWGQSNHTALDLLTSEVIDTCRAECAGDTSRGRSVADSPHPPNIPGYANATIDPPIASETTDQTDSDTGGAVAEDSQDSPTNSVSDRSHRMALRPRMPPSFQGMTSSSRSKPKTAKSQEARPPINEVPKMPPDCCPELPLPLRSSLDNPFLFSRETANRFFPFLRHLCYNHLQRYVELRYHTEQAQVSAANSARLAEHPDTPSRRRRASLPDIAPSKRPRLDTPLGLSIRPRDPEDRPAHDHIPNDACRRRALAELKQATPLRGSHGAETNRLVRELLEKVEHPNTESSHGKLEALFCTGDEAAHIVESRSVDAPIITEGQQPFKWGENGRPIEQFFRRFSTFDDLFVSVQTPSLPATGQSFQVRKFGEVKKKFLDQENTNDPLNILDLQCPVQSTVPKFLSGENCGLLIDVRTRVLMEGSAERVTAPLQKWAEWKDVDKWALLSEGGHHTAPHMDSYGYATWITAQEGPIGFAWMSLPTKEERQAWMAAPHQYTGGRWRYIILKPGQTVFFPPGTIHFVFRVRDYQTLALGGHVLQWSDIQRWLQVVLWELKKPAITNEEMKMTAPKLIHTIEELVRAKVNEIGVQELGGEEAVKGFFESVKVRMIRDCERGCANNI